MKRAIFLITLLIFSSGCNSYRVAKFETSPTIDLVVFDDNREPLPESELIGQLCKLELRDGSIVEGIISHIDKQSITMSGDKNDSALNWSNKEFIIVMKDQVSEIQLPRNSQAKTNLLTIGAGVVLAGLILLTAIKIETRHYN